MVKNVIIWAILLFSFTQSEAVTIEFVPNVDTLFAGGGCTGAEIRCELHKSDSTDSILILALRNTDFVAGNPSLVGSIRTDTVYFIVNRETGQELNYSIILAPQNTSFPAIHLPFDSTVNFILTSDFTLSAKSANTQEIARTILFEIFGGLAIRNNRSKSISSIRNNNSCNAFIYRNNTIAIKTGKEYKLTNGRQIGP